MRNTITTPLAAALLIGLSATGAAAQEGRMHRHGADSTPDAMMCPMMGGMTMGGMMGPGMMPGMTGHGETGHAMMGGGTGMMMPGGPGPAMLLRMREPLGLAEEQVRQLEQIQESRSGAMQERMRATMEAHREALALLPDVEGYERALQTAADAMVDAHVEMIRAASEAGDVLTSEQRAELERLQHTMQQMMGAPAPR